MKAKHKYETVLTHFRYNSIHDRGPYLVQWYRLDESDDDISGVGMDLNTEIKPLETFFLKMSDNFALKNYIIVPDGDELFVSIYELATDERVRRPRYLILRKDGVLDSTMSVCMEIQLLAPNDSLQKLTGLPFSIIGEII